MEPSDQTVEQNDAYSSLVSGLKYARGEGMPQDFQEAAKWLRQAANLGSVPALVNLGVLFMCGAGVRQDSVEAAGLFEKATESGDAEGQMNLARLCASGTARQRTSHEP